MNKKNRLRPLQAIIFLVSSCIVSSAGFAQIDPSATSTINFSATFPMESLLSGVPVTNQAFADIDGDGDQDIFVIENDFPVGTLSSLAWFENPGAEGTGWPHHEIDSSLPIFDPGAVDPRSFTYLFARDLDNDGDFDAVTLISGNLVWWENPGPDEPWVKHPVAFNPDLAPVDLGDLDGDGDLDIAGGLLWNEFDAGYPFWLENAAGDGATWVEHHISVLWPDGTSEELHGLAASVDQVARIHIADVNGDGDLDLFMPQGDYYPDPAVLSVRMMVLENDLGDGSTWKYYTDYLYDGPFITVDLNGDGIKEILSSDSVTWKPQTFYNGEEPNFVAEYPLLGSGPSAINGRVENLQVNDIDGDGDPDVSFSHNGSIYWLEKRGTTSCCFDNSSWLAHEIPLNMDYVFISSLDFGFADSDFDGQKDLVASIRTTDAEGGVVWWKNQGGQFALQTTSEGDVAVGVCKAFVSYPVFNIDAYHRGRPGDNDIELLKFSFLFSYDSVGTPLATEEINSMVDNISISKDGFPLVTLSNPSLVNGVLNVELPADDPDFTLIAPETPTAASTQNYSLEIVTKHVPESAPLHLFYISQLSQVDSLAKDGANNAPLISEYAPAISTLLEIEPDMPPVAVTKNIHRYVGEHVSPFDVDAGSYDDCGKLYYDLYPDVFGCFDMGAQQVTLVLEDVAGNRTEGTATVTVLDDGTCSIDSDGDGVPDYLDQCADTPEGVAVDVFGCPLDSDGDGVPDYLDQCADTPEGVAVDIFGCPLDSDGDGVPDYLDQCADTPEGVAVDAFGCPLDSDGDGVPDYLDQCPATPAGVKVNADGCPFNENRAPVANAGGPYLGPIDTMIGFDGSQSHDPDGDVLSYRWAFEDNGLDEGESVFHSFGAPGIYDLCLTVEDPWKAVDTACTVVVVYDPTGGFVTGGGWIDSPPGAYVPNPALGGKATFGFVSKYKKGSNAPTGQTEFQFKTPDFNFHSSIYEWLVVAGAKAIFKGVGTVNGQPGFGFQIMAIDASLANNTGTDRFRIKIWDMNDGDTVVYDNEIGAPEDADPTTDIAGGSIVIHKAK